MIAEVEGLVTRYLAWLQDKTEVRPAEGDWVAVTTPHLDRHNDQLVIYVRAVEGGFALTDDGYVIGDLQQSGCSLDTPKRRQLLALTLAGFGVRNEGDELVVDATAETFAVRKHNLLQAMLAINDLFYLAQPAVATLFVEDVTSWLDSWDIRHVDRLKLTGRSGYDHHFDFAIPRSRVRPERILQTINRPDRDAAQAMAFKWMDTRDVRSPEATAYALLNDQQHPVAQSVLDALRSYDVRTIMWSRRDEVREELAA